MSLLAVEGFSHASKVAAQLNRTGQSEWKATGGAPDRDRTGQSEWKAAGGAPDRDGERRH